MAGARPNFGSGVRTDNKCEGKLEARTILQTQRKTIRHLTTAFNVSIDFNILWDHSNVGNVEINLCIIRVLTGLFSLLHLWPGEAERGWTTRLPPPQGYVSDSEHTQKHQERRVTITTFNLVWYQFRDLWQINFWFSLYWIDQLILLVYLYTVSQSWYDSLGQEFVFYHITVWA